MKNYQFSTKIFLILLASFLLLLPSFSDGKADMVITTWCGPPFLKLDHTGYLDQILKEAFERMNLKIDIRRKPAERSLYDANNGNTDGEFIRVEKIGKIYPNLIMVPEHLYNMEFVAFTKRDDLKTDKGWKSLEAYKTGILRGWKILEENVIDTNGQRTVVNGQEHLFTLLANQRIDVAVYSRYFGLETIRQLGFEGIKTVEPPLATKQMYLFLHKKHKEKIHTIDKILKSMKNEGLFAEIAKKTLLK